VWRSSVYDSVCSVFAFNGFLNRAKSKNFRPQYLGQSTAYGHATYVTYTGRDPLLPDTDSCWILLPVPPGGAVNFFQFFAFNSKTRLRTLPCCTSLERARDPLQDAV